MKSLIFVTIYFFILGLQNITGQGMTCDCYGNTINNKVFEAKLTGYISPKLQINQDDHFFNKNWISGKAILNTNDTVNCKLLRFNELLNSLIWIREQDNLPVILDNSLVKGFVLDNGNMPPSVFTRLKIRQKYSLDSIQVYMQILVNGKITLYSHTYVEVFNTSGIDHYQKKVYYFLKKPDGKLNKCPVRRNSLVKLFPERREEYNNLIRSEHLNLKEEDQLIKAIQLINNL
jgi:hypothetical protein